MASDPLEALAQVITELKEKVLELNDDLNELKDRINAPPLPPVPPLPPLPPTPGRLLFGGRRARTAVRDVTTGVVYESKTSVGKALAHEAGTSADDRFAWYKLLAKFPGRFTEVTTRE